MRDLAYCILRGVNFDPIRTMILTNLILEDPTVKEDLDPITKQPWGFGEASISQGKHIHKKEEDISLEELLDVLVKYYPVMKQCGLEEIMLTLVVYYSAAKDKFDYALSPSIFKKIRMLGDDVHLGIDWYSLSTDDEVSH